MAFFQFINRLKIYKNNKNWWLLIFGGIAGGIFGLLLNLILIRPLYSAETSISSIINFYQIGHLTQFEQDQYIGQLITFSKSDDVLNSVIEKLKGTAFPIDLQSFKNVCFTERYLNEIIYRCVSESPEQAKLFSDTWGNISYSKLSEAMYHGRKYSQLISKQKQIEKCLELSSFSINSNFICAIDENNFVELSNLVEREFFLSKGLFPGISITQGATSPYPDHPTRNNMNTMVLSGVFLGLFISAILNYLNENDS